MDPPGGPRSRADVGKPPHLFRVPTLPFKLNQDRRHHIPKQKHKVTSSAAYDAALRQRGSLTVWFTDEAIAAWKAEPRTRHRAGSLGILWDCPGSVDGLWAWELCLRPCLRRLAWLT